MNEEDIRRVARQEAQAVLKEYLAAQRRKAKEEERAHQEALEDAFGVHGQG